MYIKKDIPFYAKTKVGKFIELIIGLIAFLICLIPIIFVIVGSKSIKFCDFIAEKEDQICIKLFNN